jgi:hypothetical protein
MTISNTPHLVVVREMNPDDGTSLHEFWKLESCFWYDGADAADNPAVKVYVAPWNGTHDTARDGLPISDDRATDCCSWDETPKEVRQQFREEANKIHQATATFQADE